MHHKLLLALRLLSLAAAAMAAVALPQPAAAQAVKGEVSVAVENGFARIVVLLAEEVDAKVRVANHILTIVFEKPVDIVVDRIAVNSGGYVSAARRDPDGRAIRMALARKVTMNSTAAAERLFVDLLPEGWAGLPPGLPREVIEELARRARDAERKNRQQRALERQQSIAPVRVRVAMQPTFTRYVFEMPQLTAVTADKAGDKLTLTFDGTYKFDLADAVAALPPMIASIHSEVERDSAIVRFDFSDKVDVRTFREDNSYVLDVSAPDGKAERNNAASDRLSGLAAELAARAKRPDDAGPAKTQPAKEPAEKARPTEEPPPAAEPAAPPKMAEPREVGLERRPAPPAPQTRPEPPPSDAVSPLAPPKMAEPREAELERRSSPPAPQVRPEPPPSDAVSPPVPPKMAEPREVELERRAAPPAPQARPEPPPSEAVSPPARPRAAPVVSNADARVAVRVTRRGDNVILEFPFSVATPAAVFHRGDSLWIVFGSEENIVLTALDAEIGRIIKGTSSARVRDAELVRLKLMRPMLVSANTEGAAWNITLGTEVVEPTRPLGVTRSVAGAARSSIAIPLEDPRDIYRFEDPDAGDTLLVATALAPARGFLKTQDFVEFRLLPSIHGVVVQPLADDLNAELSADKVVITRPTGLTLSATAQSNARGPTFQRQMIDPQTWGFDRQADFQDRNTKLLMAAAEAPEAKRLLARTDLARFYFARDMIYEAKAVLDVALADQAPTVENPSVVVLRAVCNIMIGRADMGLKDLANPLVGNQNDAPLWRALANAKLGKWAEAREGFRVTEPTVATLPIELQRTVMKEMIRASIEVGDITGATALMNEFEAIGIPRELEPTMTLLTGRINEGLGRVEDARRAYQTAAELSDRAASAQARLRDMVLRQSKGDAPREEAIAELETLAAIWRGDATEIETLQMLGRAYTEEGRYRDAFQVMRTAILAHPKSEMTRHIQEEAATTFDSLFLAGKGDELPAIDALAMFYDFSDLTPIGRRGDEMIRRLADRLVSVDLLKQATDLLKHQVDNRLQGAARAQVAARLAAIYLMDRKPDRALVALRTTRTSELSNELRNQRLMLEARALSEAGRHEVAIEVVANIPGREAIRLRSDIYWASKRWAQAAEQIELLYGERWREFEPLDEKERQDILRAAVGYSLAEDTLGLARFREKYAAKMGDGPDRRAFDVLTSLSAPGDGELSEIARALRAADTLERFLRDLRARYPDLGTLPAGRQRAAGAG